MLQHVHLTSAMESLDSNKANKANKIDYSALGIEAHVVLSLNLLKGGGKEKCLDPAGRQHLFASTAKNYQLPTLTASSWYFQSWFQQ